MFFLRLEFSLCHYYNYGKQGEFWKKSKEFVKAALVPRTAKKS
jgi:hypothetical protein